MGEASRRIVVPWRMSQKVWRFEINKLWWSVQVKGGRSGQRIVADGVFSVVTKNA
jgi:hypothetical protein